jgi:hypothetical protein
MPTITAYRRTVTRATYSDETGTTLQWEPWEDGIPGFSDRYSGYDEPITVELLGDWQQLVSIDGEAPPILWHPIEGAQDYSLREAIDLGIARIVGDAS